MNGIAKTMLILTGIVLLNTSTISSQDPESDRKVFLRVFSNFRHGLTEEDRDASFEVRRVYIGYKGSLDKNFSAEVKLDIGSPDDLSQFSLIRRYAYFKTAAITYQKDKLTSWFGLFDMLQFKTQEDFWGYRYLYKSFQDENKFGPSADMGAGIRYAFTSYLSGDLVLSNGEGYRNSQHNNIIKYGAGLTLKPHKTLTLRVYYDLMNSSTTQSSHSIFAGYNQEKFRIGAEYVYRENHRFSENHSLKGYSIYGTFIINSQWELFGRYDRLTSNIVEGDEIPWNLTNDATNIITGLQFSPNQGLKLSLNYQDRYSLALNGPDKAYLFFNVQFDL
jgi:hypothetical protein